MSSNVILGYSPTDFFYIDAQKSNFFDDTICGNNLHVYNSYGKIGTANYLDNKWDKICSINIDDNGNVFAGNMGGITSGNVELSTFLDNSYNCLNVAFCKNRDYAKKIIHNNNVHGGEETKYYDSKTEYDIAIMDVINLGIGIMFVIALIYKNRNMP